MPTVYNAANEEAATTETIDNNMALLTICFLIVFVPFKYIVSII